MVICNHSKRADQKRRETIPIGKYDAQSKWAAEHTTRVVMNLNHNTDADLLRYLESVPSKQGAIKQAIRFYLSHKDKILDGAMPSAILNYPNE